MQIKKNIPIFLTYGQKYINVTVFLTYELLSIYTCLQKNTWV